MEVAEMVLSSADRAFIETQRAECGVVVDDIRGNAENSPLQLAHARTRQTSFPHPKCSVPGDPSGAIKNQQQELRARIAILHLIANI